MKLYFSSINFEIEGVPVEFRGVEFWAYLPMRPNETAQQPDVTWDECRIGGVVIDPLLTGAQSDYFADRLIRYLED